MVAVRRVEYALKQRTSLGARSPLRLRSVGGRSSALPLTELSNAPVQLRAILP